MQKNRPSSDLIDRVANGERSGFDDIVALYAGDVLHLCALLLRDADDARDALQETMLRFIRYVRAGRFKPQNGSIAGLLKQIARNLCIDRLRARRGFCDVDDEKNWDAPQLRDNRTPSHAAEDARFETAFQKALDELSDLQRTVFVLRELNGESYESISDSLSLSIEAARKHMMRARKKLLVILAPYMERS